MLRKRKTAWMGTAHVNFAEVKLNQKLHLRICVKENYQGLDLRLVEAAPISGDGEEELITDSMPILLAIWKPLAETDRHAASRKYGNSMKSGFTLLPCLWCLKTQLAFYI